MPVESVPEQSAERYWTIQEIADDLRVSYMDVHRRIEAGLIEYVDVSQSPGKRRIRVSDSALRRYIASITISPRRTA